MIILIKNLFQILLYFYLILIFCYIDAIKSYFVLENKLFQYNFLLIHLKKTKY